MAEFTNIPNNKKYVMFTGGATGSGKSKLGDLVNKTLLENGKITEGIRWKELLIDDIIENNKFYKEAISNIIDEGIPEEKSDETKSDETKSDETEGEAQCNKYCKEQCGEESKEENKEESKEENKKENKEENKEELIEKFKAVVKKVINIKSIVNNLNSNFFKKKQLSTSQKSELVELMSKEEENNRNEYKKFANEFSKIYFKIRKGKYCCNKPCKIDNICISCNKYYDELVENTLKQLATKKEEDKDIGYDGIIIETTGFSLPMNWFDDEKLIGYFKQCTIIFSYMLVEPERLRERIIQRTKNSFNKYIENPYNNPAPRLPDIASLNDKIQTIQSNIEAVHQCFIDANAKNCKGNNLDIAGKPSPPFKSSSAPEMILLIYDNNNKPSQLIYNSITSDTNTDTNTSFETIIDRSLNPTDDSSVGPTGGKRNKTKKHKKGKKSKRKNKRTRKQKLIPI